MSDGQQQTTEASITFVGPIIHPWTQCFRNVLAQFASQGVQNVTILISSTGGSLFEGFSLYNIIRLMPYECHMHNIGMIQSIANIVFLAGKKRTASKHSSFLLHNFTWTFAQETLTEPQVHERAIGLESAREDFITIFEENTKLTSKDFETEKFFHAPRILRPDAAIKAGIIHAAEEVTLKERVPTFNVVQGP
jgi:ATP-dependent protease ClpP protease subunit